MKYNPCTYHGSLQYCPNHGAILDLHTMIERANAQLAKRKASLKDTLQQIEIVEQLDKQEPLAYSTTLNQLRTKARRQQDAVTATEGLIKSFNAALKKPTK